MWSPDRHIGIDRLWHIKYFAWLPLLWSLHRYWKWLFGGFLFSTMVLQGIQISGEFFGATYKGASLASGMRHPTMAGMWIAIALSCWLFLFVYAGRRVLFLSIPMAALSAVGFFGQVNARLWWEFSSRLRWRISFWELSPKVGFVRRSRVA